MARTATAVFEADVNMRLTEEQHAELVDTEGFDFARTWDYASGKLVIPAGTMQTVRYQIRKALGMVGDGTPRNGTGKMVPVSHVIQALIDSAEALRKALGDVKVSETVLHQAQGLAKSAIRSHIQSRHATERAELRKTLADANRAAAETETKAWTAYNAAATAYENLKNAGLLTEDSYVAALELAAGMREDDVTAARAAVVEAEADLAEAVEQWAEEDATLAEELASPSDGVDASEITVTATVPESVGPRYIPQPDTQDDDDDEPNPDAGAADASDAVLAQLQGIAKG